MATSSSSTRPGGQVPLNHKTVLVFDHASQFAAHCGQTFDVGNKAKAQTSAPPTCKLDPLNKSLWTCVIESAIEYARLVYDIFPTDKLIRLISSRTETPLNTWNEVDQTLDHLMNVLGTVPAPLAQQQLFEGEEAINLCKALDLAVKALVQPSPLQLRLARKHDLAPVNPGRIILFTTAKHRNLEKVQEFLSKSIEESNKNPASPMKITKIEMVVIDVVDCNQDTFKCEIIKEISSELRTRILSSRAGSFLPSRIIQLVQNFYELACTSITNIPMKEELNANSSANYDVDVLHSKSLHAQLKMCGLLQHCLINKEGVDTVCLKWSSPKTNINELSFSSGALRITPVDVNSRPASCLTSFLLGGRCVVLEIPRGAHSTNTTRIASHVLCNLGNEIFMYCLNCVGKSPLDEYTSLDGVPASRLSEYRTNEFIGLMKANNLSVLPNVWSVVGGLASLEMSTRKWPLAYGDYILSNVHALAPILRTISEPAINDVQYTECVKCIDFIQMAEQHNEPLFGAAGSVVVMTKSLRQLKKKDQYRVVYEELENCLKLYQDLSERHRVLYNHIKKIRKTALKTERANNPAEVVASILAKKPAQQVSRSDEDTFESVHHLEKLCKKRKLSCIVEAKRDDMNLLDFYTNLAAAIDRKRIEFYGRVANPNNNHAPLYINLDESTPNNTKNMSAKMEVG